MVSNITKSFKAKAARRGLGNCYAAGGDVSFRQGNSFGDSPSAAASGAMPGTASMPSGIRDMPGSMLSTPRASTMGPNLAASAGEPGTGRSLGMVGSPVYGNDMIDKGPLKSDGAVPTAAFNDSVQGRVALGQARDRMNGVAVQPPTPAAQPVLTAKEQLAAQGHNPNGLYRYDRDGNPVFLAEQRRAQLHAGMFDNGNLWNYADGGKVDPVEDLLRRTSQKYGVSNSAPPPQPASAPAPQPAPTPAPQPRPLGDVIQQRNETLRKITNYADGGKVEQYEFHGEGGPREDKIPVKFAGANIRVSDGERGMILPAKTASNPQAVDAIEDIIQSTNDGREPRRGLGNGGHYAQGLEPNLGPRTAAGASENGRWSPEATKFRAERGFTGTPVGPRPVAGAAPSGNIAPDLTIPDGAAPASQRGALGKGWDYVRQGAGKVFNMSPNPEAAAPSAAMVATPPPPPPPPSAAFKAGEVAGRAWKNLPVKPGTPVLGAAMVAPEAIMNERKRAFLDDPNVSAVDKARVTAHDVLEYGGGAVGGVLGAPVGQALMPIPFVGAGAGAVVGAGLGSAAGHAIGKAVLGDPMEGYGGEGWKLDKSKVPQLGASVPSNIPAAPTAPAAPTLPSPEISPRVFGPDPEKFPIPYVKPLVSLDIPYGFDHLVMDGGAPEFIKQGNSGDAKQTPVSNTLRFTDRSFDPTQQTFAPGTGAATVTGSAKNDGRMMPGIKRNALGTTLVVGPGSYTAKDGSETSDWTKTAAYEDAIRRNAQDQINLAQIQNERAGRDPMVSRGLGQAMMPPGADAANDMSSLEAGQRTVAQNLMSPNPGTRALAARQQALLDNMWSKQMAAQKFGYERDVKNTELATAGDDSVIRKNKALEERLMRDPDFQTKEGDKTVPDPVKIGEYLNLLASTVRRAHDEAPPEQKHLWYNGSTKKARSPGELDAAQLSELRKLYDIKRRVDSQAGPWFWNGPNVTSDDLRDYELVPHGEHFEAPRLTKKTGKTFIVPREDLSDAAGARNKFMPALGRQQTTAYLPTGGVQ